MSKREGAGEGSERSEREEAVVDRQPGGDGRWMINSTKASQEWFGQK
jgi:hypothetical protein